MAGQAGCGTGSYSESVFLLVAHSVRKDMLIFVIYFHSVPRCVGQHAPSSKLVNESKKI